MGSEWREISLGDFVRLQRGHDLPESQRQEGSVPVMGSAGQNGFHDVVKANGPGVVVGRSGVGSMGKVTYCPSDYWPHNTVLYVTDFLGNDVRFVYYYLQFLDLRRFNSGSAQASLNRNYIYPIKIRVPPLEEQKSISSFLGAIDDKIKLNRQINTTLESMAQALFKSWFVDFDPVIDNALAAGNPIPEPFMKRAQARAQKRQELHAAAQATQPANGSTDASPLNPLPAEIQQLFPSSFVFTEEMGWMPEGWEVKRLGDFADKISKGTTPTKAALAAATDREEVAFIKVKDLNDLGEIKLDGLELIPRSVHSSSLKRSMLRENDVLFSIAGTIGRVAIVPPHLDDVNANQAIAFVRPKNQNMAVYISMVLQSEQVQHLVNSRIVQAVQANFSLTELSGIPVLDAGDEIFNVWLGKAKSWSVKVNATRASSRCLALVRDILLQKLLSGQLQIPEAERQLDEVM